MANFPFEVQNVAMDGTWKTVDIDPRWNSVSIKMREAVDLEVAGQSTATQYTLPAGSSFDFSSFNFRGPGDPAGQTQIQVKAASGTLEVLGYLKR